MERTTSSGKAIAISLPEGWRVEERGRKRGCCSKEEREEGREGREGEGGRRQTFLVKEKREEEER